MYFSEVNPLFFQGRNGNRHQARGSEPFPEENAPLTSARYHLEHDKKNG